MPLLDNGSRKLLRPVKHAQSSIRLPQQVVGSRALPHSKYSVTLLRVLTQACQPAARGCNMQLASYRLVHEPLQGYATVSPLVGSSCKELQRLHTDILRNSSCLHLTLLASVLMRDRGNCQPGPTSGAT